MKNYKRIKVSDKMREKFSAFSGPPTNLMLEKYKVMIHVRKHTYATWKKICLWSHSNLSYGKDFNYSDESITIGPHEYKWPVYYWLRHEEDYVALKLVVDLS